MKTSKLILFGLGFFMIGAINVHAQKTQAAISNKTIVKANENTDVKKHTVMDKFEPKLVIPHEERIALREKYNEFIVNAKEAIDTLQISDRKRRKLLRDLKESPFSNRLSKVMTAETQFEEDN